MGRSIGKIWAGSLSQNRTCVIVVAANWSPGKALDVVRNMSMTPIASGTIGDWKQTGNPNYRTSIDQIRTNWSESTTRYADSPVGAEWVKLTVELALYTLFPSFLTQKTGAQL